MWNNLDINNLDINNSGKKDYYKFDSNNVSPELSDMKIDIQMQKRSLKMSEPINIKCCDNNINSVSDVLNLQTIKVEEMTKTAFSEKSDIKIEKLIQS